MFITWVFKREKCVCLPLTKSVALSSNCKEKKNFFFFENMLTIISGYWFALEKENCDIRAHEAKVIDINILQREEHSEC